MLQAACNSFATLGVLRALAGAAEACSDPSFMLITQMVDTVCQFGIFLLTVILVVHSKGAAIADRTLVHCQWGRHRSRRSSGLRHRPYQRRIGIVALRIHHHRRLVLRLGHSDCDFYARFTRDNQVPEST